MRPRANTISHVDINAMQLLAAATASMSSPRSNHNRHPSLSGLPALHGLGLSIAGQRQSLGKLDTAHFLSGEGETSFRSSGNMSAYTTTPDLDIDSFLFGSASTINPNALHYGDSAQSVGLEQRSPFPGTLNDISSTQTFEDNFDWVSGFENQINIRSNENVIDGSSPSAISTTSQSGMSDVMVDGSNHPAPAGTSGMWQPSVMGPPQMSNNPFAMDLNGSVFPDLLNGAPASPQPATQKINDPYLSAPSSAVRSLSPSNASGLRGVQHPMAQQALGLAAGPDRRSPYMPRGNNGASPVTTVTEATRTILVNTLAQSQTFGGRKSSPSLTTAKPAQGAGSKLPPVPDLQRYVASYMSYFHPHFPFLHLPTLSFDMNFFSSDDEGAVGGQGCLLLAISMIGALYAGDHVQSKDLFEMSKKMIFLFLEERRKAEMSRAAETRRSASTSTDNASSTHADDGSDTPLWLVQAMLLNVAYGHNVIDKIATDIASTHCIALVSLAQSAGLGKQTKLHLAGRSQDVTMGDDTNPGAWMRQTEYLENQQWLEWADMEQRKRTMYAVFTLSSLLVIAYNHAPPLTNSEIELDLPCDEEFFAAESSTAFFAKGGMQAAAHNTMPFAQALGELLHSNQRQKEHSLNGMSESIAPGQPGSQPAPKLQASSIGCLLLIYALHNYIWETRQRHQNEIWTTEETEKMHRHIEPALRAWQMLWASNPRHSTDRPDLRGLGPVSSDAIPLLDLAYVRLFIELAGAKERFWERDWAGMVAEIAKGSQIAPATEPSPPPDEMTDGKATLGGHESEKMSVRREKHLRKASFFAADSIAMSDRLGNAMSHNHGAELALPGALCIFECAQILMEWVATVQDRVGAYVGIMGKDVIDYSAMPAIMVLEDDDVKLLEKVDSLIAVAETKIRTQLDANGRGEVLILDDSGGYSTKLMHLLTLMFGRAGVWQVYKLMSQCAQSQMAGSRARTLQSVATKA